jgi:adenylosuccinate lyase
MGKEIAVIINRLNSQIQQINQVEILGKINGAVGNFNAHIAAYPELDWPKISEQFIEKLGLKSNPYTTQIEPHDWIAEYCHGMIRINNILQDFCVDVWLYISKGYFKSKAISTETGSSTMPHKVNPIDFENAEGNLGLSVALLDYLSIKLTKSRLQRDLTDSTTLRNLGIAFGYQIIALKSLLKGISKLELNEELMLEELNQEPSVLAEAIQTVMRKHGIADAYEQLKAFTRGKVITLENIIELIDQVDIPEADKVRLKALKPEDYIGLAKDLAKNI